MHLLLPALDVVRVSRVNFVLQATVSALADSVDSALCVLPVVLEAKVVLFQR